MANNKTSTEWYYSYFFLKMPAVLFIAYATLYMRICGVADETAMKIRT